MKYARESLISFQLNMEEVISLANSFGFIFDETIDLVILVQDLAFKKMETIRKKIGGSNPNQTFL